MCLDFTKGLPISSPHFSTLAIGKWCKPPFGARRALAQPPACSQASPTNLAALPVLPNRSGQPSKAGRPANPRNTVPNWRHELGNLLVQAVFEAALRVFERKTAQYVRLASYGTGKLTPGELPVELQTILGEQASKLASNFLNICIRAIDYCPPVDLELGEYLRALITADYDLVPDDRWAYREALIDAFR